MLRMSSVIGFHTDGDNYLFTGRQYTDSQRFTLEKKQAGVQGGEDIASSVTSCKLRLTWYGTTALGYISTDGGVSWAAAGDGVTCSLTSIAAALLTYDAPTITYDDFFIRKFCPPEPTWGAWGSEETGGVA